MPNSILEAIEQGIWDFEPEDQYDEKCRSTDALPGSSAKLKIMADRIASGRPLWHPDDRMTYEDYLESKGGASPAKDD
jgi:hypothetical protein